MMNNWFSYWENLGDYRYMVGLFVLLFIFHLIYVIYQSIIICRKEKGMMSGEPEGVSVVLTANNKADCLRENLEYFLKQDYPSYEVIVVDECSEDETQDVLAEMQQKFPHLRTTRIFPDTKFRNTKKLAINIGILAAHYDIVLFSEMNCRPASEHWISTMQSYFTPDTAVVIGYANYVTGKEKVSVRRLFRFMRFLKNILLIRQKCFVLGDGFNMGYRKKFYLARKVFSKNSQSYFGYDNEIVKMLSSLGKVRIAKNMQASVIINDLRKKTWKEDFTYYYFNKRKWSLSALCKADVNTHLRMLFYVLGYLLIFTKVLCNFTLICVSLTFLIDFIVINAYLRHLEQRKLFLTSFIISSIGFLYRWYYNVYSIFTNKKWR